MLRSNDMLSPTSYRCRRAGGGVIVKGPGAETPVCRATVSLVWIESRWPPWLFNTGNPEPEGAMPPAAPTVAADRWSATRGHAGPTDAAADHPGRQRAAGPDRRCGPGQTTRTPEAALTERTIRGDVITAVTAGQGGGTGTRRCQRHCQVGVVYTGGKGKIAEHGLDLVAAGVVVAHRVPGDDERDVAVLRVRPAATRIAPTILTLAVGGRDASESPGLVRRQTPDYYFNTQAGDPRIPDLIGITQQHVLGRRRMVSTVIVRVVLLGTTLARARTRNYLKPSRSNTPTPSTSADPGRPATPPVGKQTGAAPRARRCRKPGTGTIRESIIGRDDRAGPTLSGCRGTLHRLTLPADTAGQTTHRTRQVSPCSGRCELTDAPLVERWFDAVLASCWADGGGDELKASFAILGDGVDPRCVGRGLTWPSTPVAQHLDV